MAVISFSTSPFNFFAINNNQNIGAAFKIVAARCAFETVAASLETKSLISSSIERTARLAAKDE